MSSRIRFQLNDEKALEAVVWLATESPGISFYYLSKILYFADKQHLIKYGRPVLGDRYIAMNDGPVPSGVYDLVKESWLEPPPIAKAVSEALTIERPRIRANRKPNLDYFSESDLECLGDSLEKYGDMPWLMLRKIAHNERAWDEASLNGEMDYALIIDEDVPNRDKLVEELLESARLLAL